MYSNWLLHITLTFVLLTQITNYKKFYHMMVFQGTSVLQKPVSAVWSIFQECKVSRWPMYAMAFFWVVLLCAENTCSDVQWSAFLVYRKIANHNLPLPFFVAKKWNEIRIEIEENQDQGYWETLPKFWFLGYKFIYKSPLSGFNMILFWS